MTTIIALLIALQPSAPITDTVSFIEVNHFYDDQGRLVFDQIIFWDFHPAESRYHVVAWRMYKQDSQFPTREHRVGRGYVTIWHDGDLLRRVRTCIVQETWTQFDPELVEREWLEKSKRRGLTKHRRVKQ